MHCVASTTQQVLKDAGLVSTLWGQRGVNSGFLTLSGMEQPSADHMIFRNVRELAGSCATRGTTAHPLSVSSFVFLSECVKQISCSEDAINVPSSVHLQKDGRSSDRACKGWG